MYQVIDREKYEIQGRDSDSDPFLELRNNSDKIIFIHPTTSLFFDNLTTFRFAHIEILISQNYNLNIKRKILINKVVPKKYDSFDSYSIPFIYKINGFHYNFKCISPEFGVIWFLQEVNSQSLTMALALLEFSKINILNKILHLLPEKKALQLVLELGKTPLNRYDRIWEIIEKYGYEKRLNDFPLFLDRNIRIDRKYDKIL